MIEHREFEKTHANQPLAISGIQEVAYALSHLKSSFEQTKQNTLVKGTVFLSATLANLPEDSPFYSRNEVLSVKLLPLGYHVAVYKVTNQTTGKEFVMKVGVPHSPIHAPDPSSEEYAHWYQKGLDEQRRIFQKKMPYFIPEPQTVLYPATDPYGSSTVILQPYIKGARSLNKIGRLPKEERQTIAEEFQVFHDLWRSFSKETGLQLDFLRSGTHLVIGQIEGKPHLVLLDNGVFQKNYTPIFFVGSHIFGAVREKMAARQADRK